MILEREPELAELSALLDDVGVGGGRVVLVRGEAGIGKTALVESFLAGSTGRARVLSGGCDHLVTPQPFAPLWDVARHAPSLAGPLSAGEGRAVMEALLALLSREGWPTALVIEDVQWADEATLDAIKFLGRRAARTNGLLVLTYRDGEVDADHPLRQVIGELPHRNVVRLPLRPLSAEAVTQLVGDRAFSVGEVLELTGGNPLFVTEVVASGTDAVPSSVQDSVLARASKLSPTARELLHLVSVVPGGAERDLLDRLLELEPGHVREGVQQGLLVDDGVSLTFRHELQRRAVESALEPQDRRRLNRQVLDQLPDGADPARLVHHAMEAGDVDALVTHAPRAARAAAAVRSHREAVAHFRVLAEHLHRIDPVVRAQLLKDWAKVESITGEADAVDLASEAVSLRRELGDEAALADTLTFAAGIYERNGMIDEADAAAAESVAILEQHPPSRALAAALTQAGWLWFMRGTDDRRALALIERAIDMAEREGDELSVVRAMTWKGAIAHNGGDPAGFPLVEEAAQRAAEGGFAYEETVALVNLAGMSGDVRQVARAADYARRARETAARHEIRSLEAYAQAIHAEIQLWEGDWDRAEDTATSALEGPPHSTTVAWRILAQLQARRGRGEAASVLARVWSFAERSGELQQMDPAASVMAEYAWLSDDRDEGRLGLIASVLERARKSGPPWPSGALVFWAWKVGLIESPPDHTPACFQAIIDGQPHVAAAFWRSRGVPYEEAVALMHGDVDDQRRALSIFEDLGAEAAAHRVRASLRERGVRVPRGRSAAARSHPAGLTARQAEVLDLLVDGRSNPEIADRLFISHRTVENHVAAILMKLDVPDRQAAAEIARELGLASTA